MQAEQTVLKISIGMTILIACSGILFGIVTGSFSIAFDGACLACRCQHEHAGAGGRPADRHRCRPKPWQGQAAGAVLARILASRADRAGAEWYPFDERRCLRADQRHHQYSVRGPHPQIRLRNHVYTVITLAGCLTMAILVRKKNATIRSGVPDARCHGMADVRRHHRGPALIAFIAGFFDAKAHRSPGSRLISIRPFWRWFQSRPSSRCRSARSRQALSGSSVG